MNVQLEIPEEFARELAADAPGLARAALEALAAEGVRSGKLTTFKRAACWELDRALTWMPFSRHTGFSWT
jgi:hypothetical protein